MEDEGETGVRKLSPITQATHAESQVASVVMERFKRQKGQDFMFRYNAGKVGVKVPGLTNQMGERRESIWMR